MIVLNNIEKYFSRSTANEIHALKNVSLAVNNGQYLVLLGSNGSGKSTLLNCIGGSIIPDSGTILFDELQVASLPEHQRSKWVARVFQNPLAGTAADLSVVENFRLASIRTQRKSVSIGTTKSFRRLIREKIAQLNLGLENKLDQPMGNLSGGQRQALTLLMAVMDDAKILLLDEPTSALDPNTSEIIMKLADQLIKHHKLTAILVTHNLKDALNYGDRIVIMKDGFIANDLLKSENANLSAIDLLTFF